MSYFPRPCFAALSLEIGDVFCVPAGMFAEALLLNIHPNVFALKYFEGVQSYRTVLYRLCELAVHIQLQQMLISSVLQFIFIFTISLYCLKAVFCKCLRLNSSDQHP